MIAQGADRISRGFLEEGVSLEKYMLTCILFNEDAISRYPPLEVWIQS